MRTDFLTDEERLYLEEHLEEIIQVFKQSCDELKEELKLIYKANGDFVDSSYNRFLKWSFKELISFKVPVKCLIISIITYLLLGSFVVSGCSTSGQHGCHHCYDRKEGNDSFEFHK